MPDTAFFLMKQKPIICLLIFLLFVSCNDCRNEDCPAHRRFQFQVKNASGKSLFGSTRFAQGVNTDSIKLVSLDQSNNELEIPIRQAGATLSFQPIMGNNNYLIRYSFAKDDSLTFDYLEVYDNKCCNSVLTEFLVEINSNGVLISSEADSIFALVK